MDPIQQANHLTDLARADRWMLEYAVEQLSVNELHATLIELAALRAMDLQRITDTYALDMRDRLGEFDDPSTD